MCKIADFNDVYNSYLNKHKFYTYDKLIQKYPDIENDAFMIIDSQKNKCVIGDEYEDTNLWFTTKNVLETIKINNMEKHDVLYVAKVDLCKDTYFNRSPKHIITTNKIIIREIKQVRVVKKFIVFD